jgi:hypothetical protein
MHSTIHHTAQKQSSSPKFQQPPVLLKKKKNHTLTKAEVTNKLTTKAIYGQDSTSCSFPHPSFLPYFDHQKQGSSTYGHRNKKTRVPVRSLIDKLVIGGLVVGWVTTSESPLLYVFGNFILLLGIMGEVGIVCPY